MRCFRIFAITLVLIFLCLCIAFSCLNKEKQKKLTDDFDSFVSESELLPEVPQGYCLERPQINVDITLPLEKGEVSSLFGMRENPVTGEYKFHAGYDIAAEQGTEIRCVMEGKVRKSGFDSGYGNYVIVTHCNNIETLYAHMNECFVKEDDELNKGHKIGTVGQTGAATGDHLHIELRIDSIRYDPEWILCGAYS